MDRQLKRKKRKLLKRKLRPIDVAIDKGKREQLITSYVYAGLLLSLIQPCVESALRNAITVHFYFAGPKAKKRSGTKKSRETLEELVNKVEQGTPEFFCQNILYRAFSLTWPASMLIYWNKRKFLHKKRLQLPQGCLGTPTWPPFYCFGAPIWPP